MKRPTRFLLPFTLACHLALAQEFNAPPPSEVFAKITALVQEGKVAEAETVMRTAMKKLEAEVAPDDPAIHFHRVSLSLLLGRQGKLEEAIGLAGDAATALDKSPLGPQDPHSMVARWAAAGWARDAKQPARAVELLAPLYRTLKEYVATGRAQRADWDRLPAEQQILIKNLPRLDESGVATVAADLGMLLADAGREEEALPLLDEAAAALEKLFGPGHPELVEVSEALEKIGRTREGKGVRHYVGSLGRTRSIEFQGNKAFATDDLRKALAQDIPFVLASHPSERFDTFLPLIADRLRRGYLNSGFPEATVETTYLAEKERERILANVVEGPSFRRGKIRVHGAKPIDTDKLATALQNDPAADAEGSLAGRIRGFMAPQAKLLPPPAGTPGLEATVDKINGQVPGFSLGTKPGEESPQQDLLKPLFNTSTSKQADWVPGTPVSFGDHAVNPLADRVRFRLSEQGWPQPRFTTSYDLMPDGTADLVIDIADPGPEALVGKVEISGCIRNPEDEVRKLAGLTTGSPFLPSHLEDAMLALWRSGRFDVFEIDMQPRGVSTPLVDFHIRLLELQWGPTLPTPPTPEQEVVLRGIDWINRGMDGEDLIVEWNPENQPRLLAGMSQKDGWIVDFLDPTEARGFALSMDPAGAAVAVRRGMTILPARFDVSLGKVRSFLHFMPSDEKNAFAMSAGSGLGAAATGTSNVPSLDLMISPAVIFHPNIRIRRKASTLILQFKDKESTITIDAGSGRPIAIKEAAIRNGRGSVAELQRSHRAGIEATGAGGSAVHWVDAATALLEMAEEQELISPEDYRSHLDLARKTARLLDLAGGSGALKSLRDWFAGFSGKKGNTAVFMIPVDPEELQNLGTMSLMVSFGYLWMAEEYLPDVEWAGTFARELMFILGGKTQHSRKVFDRLLEDPAIGPYGCIVCARLLDKIAAGVARRFRMKARQQCSAEAFRHDWKLFVDSPTPLGRVFDRTLESLAALSPEDEAKAIELLPADLSGWLRPFLQTLRESAADQPRSGRIGHHLDRLWNDSLGPRLREQLDRQLSPPADPAEIAATVDGVPVPRYAVKIIAEQHMGLLRCLSLPEPHESRPWTRDRALTGAVRMILIRDMLMKAGQYPAAEQINAIMDRHFPDLIGQPDEAWIARTGLSRARFSEWAGLIGGIQTLRAGFRGQFEAAPDDRVLRDYYESRNATYALRIDTDLVFVPATEGTPAALASTYQHVVELGKILAGGKTVADLQQSGELDAIPGAQAFSRQEADSITFQFAAMQAVTALKPGEATEPLELGSGIAVFVLRASRPKGVPRFEEVKETVLEHWREDQITTAARKWFEDREAAAVIEVLELPEPRE